MQCAFETSEEHLGSTLVPKAKHLLSSSKTVTNQLLIEPLILASASKQSKLGQERVCMDLITQEKIISFS